MRTILTLSAVVVLAAACAPRPHPYPVAEAPYLLHVPAPGTDYRYRSGPQGFGRTGPVYAPGPYGPGPAHGGHGQAYQGPAPQGPPPGYGGYGYGYEAYGEAPRVQGYSDGYSWGDRRHSVRGGSSYESREMMTEETYVTGGVIVERERPRAPHRPDPAPYRDTSGYTSYPGPYAESSRFEPRRAEPSPYAAPPAGPPPVRQPQPQQPYPDAGPEPFY
ncbi:hypothetical protein [Brevundimonas sp.]|uniref:hypothetical protein n=1 Tax=Brevundimonas sp. TaxID=1871086 RepID=UPI001DFC9C03|nr:hypothetical protein [Brevundimonas sp.]MBA4001233.1 hypothetical protein [Brevundimonas sp.]